MKHAFTACAFLAIGVVPAHADTLEEALQATRVYGQVGVYDFTYLNNSHTAKTANDFAIGGNVDLHTGSFRGFSVGVGAYTAQSLNLYDRHTTTDLTGTTHSLQSVREAYLQYDRNFLTLRAGRQMLNTPYANQDWFTFNPRAFMGFAGVLDVLGGNRTVADGAPLSLTGDSANLAIFGARMFDVDGRFENSFVTGNRYQDSSNGLMSFGVQYQHSIHGAAVKLQGWYYNFYALGRSVYGQADVTVPVTSGVSVLAAAQIEDDNASASASGAYGRVDAHIYGGKLGLNLGKDSVALIGDFSPVAYNSFRHGGDIHPFNDTSGTIFTDTMQMGLDDLGPGYALGVTGNVLLLNGKLAITPTYVEYKVDYGYGAETFTYGGPYGYPSATYVPNQHFHVVDANFNYALSDVLKGLSLDWDTDAVMAAQSGHGETFNNPYFSSRAYVRYSF